MQQQQQQIPVDMDMDAMQQEPQEEPVEFAADPFNEPVPTTTEEIPNFVDRTIIPLSQLRGGKAKWLSTLQRIRLASNQKAALLKKARERESKEEGGEKRKTIYSRRTLKRLL